VPIYEYTCRGCGNRFEALVFGQTQPVCPSCRGAALDKQFSVCAMTPNPNGQLGPDTRGNHVRPHEPGPVCPITPE